MANTPARHAPRPEAGAPSGAVLDFRKPGALTDLPPKRTPQTMTETQTTPRQIPFDPKVRFRRAPGAAMQLIGTRACLWRRDDKTLLPLDPMGAEIWNLVAKPLSSRRLLRALTAVYPMADPARLLADAARALAELQARGMIEQDR